MMPSANYPAMATRLSNSQGEERRKASTEVIGPKAMNPLAR